MTLPQPSPEAQAQSARLLELLRADIAAQGGWVPFSRYMERALYAPGLGYYSGGAHKFGPAGDFITSPELTPLFGQALAAQVAQVLVASAPQVLEVGAGTGLLAADLLRELARLDQLPEQYAILELSGELRVRQQATLREQAPEWLSRVVWLDRLPEQFAGAVVANEVLDVMPVDIVASRPEGLFERGVAVDDTGALRWADRPASARVQAAVQPLNLPQPYSGEYVTEICPAAQAWTAEWGRRLSRGAVLLIDYGYPRAEYYLPSRSNGTLLCYYRHHAHPDPFFWPGLNDITAFVDFTAIAEAGFDAGLDVAGYVNQATFLFNCGILERLEARGERTSADYIRAARAVQRLTTPQEMGELFKVLALTRGITSQLLGFVRGDRTHTL